MSDKCIAFSVDGREYKLEFDFNDLVEIEDELALSWLDGSIDFQKLKLKSIRKLLYIGLKKHQPLFQHQESVGELITIPNLNFFIEKIAQAIKTHIPQSEQTIQTQ